MISYIQAPVLVLCFFILLAMWRFWACIGRMGFTREVGQRAPMMVHGDIVAAVLAIMPFLIAVAAWSGVVLPGQEESLSSALGAVLSLGCVGGCFLVLRQSGERFAGHWAGTRESALRTVAALRIIEAAELAHALDVARQHAVSGSPVIDADVWEVRK